MSRHDGLSPWHTPVSTHLPHLSPAHAYGLALSSYGMVLARSCGITSVTALLAPLLACKQSALRQRLREWWYAAADKRGAKRTALEVTTCFAPRLRWVLAWWPAGERRLVLAMDATTLGQRFTVLTISVVSRGCAIPVAWAVVPARRKGAWRPHGCALFDQLQGRVPTEGTVLVLADRGLSARWLVQHLVKRGWHPFLRINQGGHCRPEGAATFRPRATVVSAVGRQGCGQGTWFSTRECHLPWTLLARWDAGYAEPWLILTDLPPETAEAAWSGMRTWIEAGSRP